MSWLDYKRIISQGYAPIAQWESARQGNPNTPQDALKVAILHTVIDAKDMVALERLCSAIISLAKEAASLQQRSLPMPETILTCPFCGSDEVELCRTNPGACWVECAHCGAQTKSAPEREQAIANWNASASRHPTATIVDDGDAEYWQTMQWIHANEKAQEDGESEQ